MRHLSARARSVRAFSLSVTLPLALASMAACGHDALIAKPPPPLIEAPETLEFGTVAPGQTKTLPLQVKNLSNEPLRLFASLQPAGQFSLSETILFLERGGVASLDVGYTGLDEDRDDAATLTFQSTDGAGVTAQTNVTAMSGVACPEPGVEIPVGPDGVSSGGQMVWDGTRYVVYSRQAPPEIWTISSEGDVHRVGTAPSVSAWPTLVRDPSGTAWLLNPSPASDQPVVLVDALAQHPNIVVSGRGSTVLGAGFDPMRNVFAFAFTAYTPSPGDVLLSRIEPSSGTSTDTDRSVGEAQIGTAELLPDGSGFAALTSVGGQWQLSRLNFEGPAVPSVALTFDSPLPSTLIVPGAESVAMFEWIRAMSVEVVRGDGTRSGPVSLSGEISDAPTAVWTGSGWLLAWSHFTARDLGRVLVAWLAPDGTLQKGPMVASCTTRGPPTTVSLAADPEHGRAALLWTAERHPTLQTRVRFLPLVP